MLYRGCERDDTVSSLSRLQRAPTGRDAEGRLPNPCVVNGDLTDVGNTDGPMHHLVDRRLKKENVDHSQEERNYLCDQSVRTTPKSTALVMSPAMMGSTA